MRVASAACALALAAPAASFITPVQQLRSPAFSQSTRASQPKMSAIADTWQQYLDLLDSAPLLTKSITAGLLFPAADVLAQLIEQKQKRDKADESTALLR
jgi:hypothetical protein